MPVAEGIINRALYIILFSVVVFVAPFILKRDVVIGLTFQEVIVLVTAVVVFATVLTTLIAASIKRRVKH